MAKTGRPATVARKTSIGIRHGLVGWIDFMTLEHHGVAAYLNDLAEADRSHAMQEGGDTFERYRAYLVATGRTDELGSLDSLDLDA